MEHRNMGDILVKVGEYHDDQRNQKRNRNRAVGTLWATRHTDGSVRYWIKFNQDALAPTLANLTGRYAKPGDDTVPMSVFAKDDGGGRGDSQRPPAQQQQQQPAASTGQRGAPMNDDDIDF